MDTVKRKAGKRAIRTVVPMLFLLLASCLHAQDRQYKFRLIDASDGLSDGQIRSLTMTEEGCIAIKTGFILNIYNGATFDRFPYDKTRKYIWAYDRPPKEYYDREGRMWLKELGYLLLLDMKSGQYDYSVSEVLASMGINQRLKNLFIDDYKNYWFVTEDNTVSFYDVEQGRLRTIEDGGSEFTRKYGVPVEMTQYKNLCWIVYESGLIRYWDYSSAEFVSQETRFLHVINRLTDRIYLHPDAQGNIWLMYNNGLFFYNRMERTWKEACGISGLSNFFTCMDLDRDGNVWVGTSKSGLRIIDARTFEVTTLPALELTDGGTLENDIYTVFSDWNGGIWVGTLFQGLCYYHPSMQKFSLGHTVNRYSSVTSESIRCFLEDADGSVLIGGVFGLFRFRPSTGAMEQVFKAEPNDICLSVFKDKGGRIWVGTFLHGFYCIEGGQVRNLLRSTVNWEQDPNQNISRALYEDSEGRYWASVTGGVGRFEPATGKIAYMLHDRHPELRSYAVVHAFYPVDGHTFAALGNSGIYYYDTQKDSVWIPAFLKEQRYADTKYFCMLKDRHGVEWFGTEDGILVFDPRHKEATVLTESDGLPNNAVTALLEDNEGMVWASTLNGLCKIAPREDPAGKGFSVVSYGETDGLQGGKFYENAALKTRSGLLFFGGAHGFNYFNPSEIRYDRSDNHPVFTRFYLFNNPLKVNEAYNGHVILTQTVDRTSEIRLRHDENFVMIEFSGLNYVNPSHTYYKYKLLNYDKEWNEVVADGSGRATYTGLQPGEYKFVVYTANGDKIWGKTPTEITITIAPPFWATAWAIAVYVVLAAGLMVWSWRRFRRRAQLKIRMAQEANERKQREELDQMKFRFFTNISHEFRTPLTLILTPLGALIHDTGEPELKKKLEPIYNNARRLLNLVNQLLDFRKLEMKGERLRLKMNDMVFFLEEAVRQFTDLAASREIELSFEPKVERLFMNYDSDKMYKMLNNLLSNAFKFSSAHGQVRVTVEKVSEDGRPYAAVRVEDTGCGIAEKDLPFVFDRFYQTATEGQLAGQGSGIGLHLVREYAKLHEGKVTVESRTGEGTAFTLYIPTDLHGGGTAPAAEEKAEYRDEESEIHDMPPTETGRKKILVVEDHDEFRHFLVEQLQKDFCVVEARDGVEGEQAARTELPDLIVSDLMMPRMDGMELCRRLKGDIQTSHIPFILLTARSSDDSRIGGYEAGADSYISKPFNWEMLQVRIRQLIEQKERRQKMFRKSIDVSFEAITTTSIDEKLMEEALESVKKNISNPEYSVGDLSLDVGMSKTQLNRKMQAIVNVTPLQFIRSIRLKRAAQLLKATTCSVNEIADLTGFNTIKYFNLHFKEEFGMTPTQFREKEGKAQNDVTIG